MEQTRTSSPIVASSPPWLLLAAAASVLAAAVLLRPGGFLEPQAGPLPGDIVALGTSVDRASEDGAISEADALSVARHEYPEVFTDGRVEAFLINLTDPSLLNGLVDRKLWVIRAEGLSLDIFSAPMLPDGTGRDPGVATTAYIYVDAVTGEWLTARFDGYAP